MTNPGPGETKWDAFQAGGAECEPHRPSNEISGSVVEFAERDVAGACHLAQHQVGRCVLAASTTDVPCSLSTS